MCEHGRRLDEDHSGEYDDENGRARHSDKELVGNSCRADRSVRCARPVSSRLRVGDRSAASATGPASFSSFSSLSSLEGVATAASAAAIGTGR